MLPGGQQCRPVAGYPQGMPFDPGQDGGRQHDIIAAKPGRGGEGEVHPAHPAERHVEQVAAVHVKLGPQLVQLGEQALGQVDRQAGHLDLQGFVMLVRRLDHHDVPAVLVGHQQQGQAQAPEGRPGPVRQVRQRGCREPQRWHPLPRDQLLQ